MSGSKRRTLALTGFADAHNKVTPTERCRPPKRKDVITLYCLIRKNVFLLVQALLGKEKGQGVKEKEEEEEEGQERRRRCRHPDADRGRDVVDPRLPKADTILACKSVSGVSQKRRRRQSSIQFVSPRAVQVADARPAHSAIRTLPRLNGKPIRG